MKTPQNRFEYAARIVLYGIAAFLPIWLVPFFSLGAEFGREVTFTVLIIIAALLWLLSILTRGEIRFFLSPVLYAALIFLLFIGISAIFSTAPFVSAFLASPAAERLSTIILGALLFVLFGSIFRTQEEAWTATFLLIATAALSALVNAVQLIFDISLFQYVSPIVSESPSFNVIGTVNGLALFYVALLSLSLGLLLGRRSKLIARSPLISYFLAFVSLLFLLNLFLINFLTSWIVLLGVSIFLFGFAFKDVRAQGGTFDARYWFALLFVALSIVMIMARSPITESIAIPAEVAPSFRATINIAEGTFREGWKQILFGNGPGLFELDWSKYKDPSINQTVFWGVRFNQGSSWFSTSFSTIGIIGILSFLILLAAAFFSFLRVILAYGTGESSLPTGLFLAFVSLLLSFFLYPGNYSSVLLLFLLFGILVFLLSKQKGGSFFDHSMHSLAFEEPWVVFVSSLVVVFFLSLGVVALYTETEKVRASLAKQEGARLLDRGEVKEAALQFERAARIEPRNFRNHNLLVQARIEELRRFIQQAAAGENVQQEFQSTVSVAIQDSQRAIALHPEEPNSWRIQGSLYELLIPFIQGSERFSFDAYRKATELDPLNPSAFVDLGRSGLVFADRIQIAAGQASAQEKEQFLHAHSQILNEASQAFTKAVDVKGDFSQAHFLLAQTAMRQGNAAQAIRSAENAKLSSPFDIGIAFQLGLLYYQNSDFDRAREEFQRAISINSNYSNARYFLGLIYDRQGDRGKAQEEFEKVESFNPDNSEIKRILSNLRNGKDALDGVTPPPEERSEVPVGDK